MAHIIIKPPLQQFPLFFRHITKIVTYQSPDLVNFLMTFKKMLNIPGKWTQIHIIQRNQQLFHRAKMQCADPQYVFLVSCPFLFLCYSCSLVQMLVSRGQRCFLSTLLLQLRHLICPKRDSRRFDLSRPPSEKSILKHPLITR